MKQQDLIAVGMRYYPEYRNMRLSAQKVYSVVLKLVQHELGVDGLVVDVLYKDTKIASIRNKDLTPDFLQYMSCEQQITAKVVKQYPHYLVIKLDMHEDSKEEYLTNSDEGYCDLYDCYNTNPCAEVPLPTGNKPHPKYVPFTPTMKFNSNSMRDNFFREINNVVIDIQTGKLGFQSQDGITTYDGGSVQVNPIQELGVKIPAFAMRVAVSDLREGDIIVTSNDTVFFKEHTEAGYAVVTISGEVRQVGSVTNMFFGKNTVLAVKNMFGGTSGMDPMMMAMMMGDGKSGFDMKTFALMSMMGNGGNGMDNNMLMMAMLMKE